MAFSVSHTFDPSMFAAIVFYLQLSKAAFSLMMKKYFMLIIYTMEFALFERVCVSNFLLVALYNSCIYLLI